MKEVSRLNSIPVGGYSLELPCFFPSISSIKSNFKILDCLKALKIFEYNHFLISAYDIHNNDPSQRVIINYLLKEEKNNKKIILLDSGNYESYWNNDKEWSAETFRTILDLNVYNLAFSFDYQDLQESVDISSQIIEDSVIKDQERFLSGTIIPIIHTIKDNVVGVARNIANRLKPVMIAFPERNLGDGLIDRAKTLWEIRKALNESGEYYPIHLLGTDSPISILVYCYCGADSFDGLGWYTSSIDKETGLSYHFHQREILNWQAPICDEKEIPYNLATLGHNLSCYESLMQEIQEAIKSNKMNDLIEKYLPKSFIKSLQDNIPEVFNEQI